MMLNLTPLWYDWVLVNGFEWMCIDSSKPGSFPFMGDLSNYANYDRLLLLGRIR